MKQKEYTADEVRAMFRKILADEGLSLRQGVKATGVSLANMSRILSGKYEPSKKFLKAVKMTRKVTYVPVK